MNGRYVAVIAKHSLYKVLVVLGNRHDEPIIGDLVILRANVGRLQKARIRHASTIRLRLPIQLI